MNYQWDEQSDNDHKNLPFHMTKIVLGAVEANKKLLDDIEHEFDNPGHFPNCTSAFEELASKVDGYFFLIAYHLRKICKNVHGVTAQHIMNIIHDLNEPVEAYTIDNELAMYGEKQYGFGEAFALEYEKYLKTVKMEGTTQ